MRTFFGAAVMLLFSVPVFGETIHLTATTCHECWAPQILPTHTVDAYLEIVPGTGTYWDRFFQADVVSGPDIYEVVGLTGVFDGIYPMTLALGPPSMDNGRSWVSKTTFGSSVFIMPGLVWFSSGFGLQGIWWDHGYELMDVPGAPAFVPIQYSATLVPESSTIVMLGVGLSFLWVSKRWRESTG